MGVAKHYMDANYICDFALTANKQHLSIAHVVSTAIKCRCSKVNILHYKQNTEDSNQEALSGGKQ